MARTKQYDIGDVVRCTGTFADSDGVATDPDVVTASVKQPDETIATYTYGVDGELARLGVGIYYIDVEAAAPGAWWYRFASTGAGQGAAERLFVVINSEFI